MIPVAVGLFTSLLKRVPAIAWLVVILSAGLVFQQKFYRGKIKRQAATVARLRYERDSIDVMKDTTVTMLLDSITALSEKRILQVPLDSGKRSSTNIVAVVPPVTIKTPALTTPASAEWRGARYKMYGAPYTVDIDIIVPPPPDSAFAGLVIALDTLFMDAVVRCLPATDIATGFRPARLSIRHPSWIDLKMSVQQEPEVCNPTLPSLLSEEKTWWQKHRVKVVGGGLTLLGGFLIGRAQ